MQAMPSPRRFRRLILIPLALAAVLAGQLGCVNLDEKQSEWIFQPGDRTWRGGVVAAEGMQDVWIPFASKADGHEGEQVKLHALWLPQDDPAAPVLLYLHGARYDVRGSAPRMRRMHELGFAVLAVDYRGFGKSTVVRPTERLAVEDARAAWDWLAQQRPHTRRFVFGHSLGGAIAVQLATEIDDEAGLIVEGSFTSIPDVVSTFRWGWLPVSPFITQRFDAASRIGEVGSPVLVVHGSNDQTIPLALGQQLFEKARAPKRLVVVEGGSHHNTNAVGQPQYREAMAELFGLGSPR
jgi:alpha-beta hydrolase superfamily lysophospholipase